jgi:hypothetical protein
VDGPIRCSSLTLEREELLKYQHIMKCYTGPHTFLGSCEYGNEPLGSINGREFLE